MSEFYRDFQASLLNFCKTVRDDLAAEGINLTIVKWDAFAEIEELPDGDLIGPMDFSVECDGTETGSALIAVSTEKDTNIERLDRIISLIYSRLKKPGEMLPLLNASTGQQRSWMTVMEGTAVLPILRAKTRALKAVAVSLAAVDPPAP